MAPKKRKLSAFEEENNNNNNDTILNNNNNIIINDKVEVENVNLIKMGIREKLPTNVLQKLNLIAQIKTLEKNPDKIVTVLGQTSAGKSSLIARLLGVMNLIPQKSGECTCFCAKITSIPYTNQPYKFILSKPADFHSINDSNDINNINNNNNNNEIQNEEREKGFSILGVRVPFSVSIYSPNKKIAFNFISNCLLI